MCAISNKTYENRHIQSFINFGMRSQVEFRKENWERGKKPFPQGLVETYNGRGPFCSQINSVHHTFTELLVCKSLSLTLPINTYILGGEYSMQKNHL